MKINGKPVELTPKEYSILEIAQICIKVVKKGRVEVLKTRKSRKASSRFLLNCDAARKTFGFKTSLDLPSGLLKTWNDMNKLSLEP